MKKCFWILATLLVLICLSSFLVGFTNEKTTIKGIAYLDVPLTEWREEGQAKLVEADLIIERFIIDKSSVEIIGELIYDANVFKIDKKGVARKSSSNKGDYIIDFGEDRLTKSSGEISLVHVAFRESINEDNLLINVVRQANLQ